MSENPNTHLNASRFLAERARTAPTVNAKHPVLFALPGSLAPIPADRLDAHQQDGLGEREIVEYENARFLATNVRVRERHAQWVSRDYDAMVRAHQELEAEKQRREAEAAANYRRRVGELLAGRHDA